MNRSQILIIINFFFSSSLLVFFAAGQLHSQNEDIAPGNNSEFISQFFPEKMDTGKQYKVWINMKNIGEETWTSYSSDGGEYKLVFTGSSSYEAGNFFGDVAEVFLNHDVMPGQTAIFQFNVIAPSNTGTYVSQWRMKKGIRFFGEETQRVSITISDNSNDVSLVSDAKFIKLTIPKIMKCNFRSAVSVLVENCGTKKWLKDKFSLALVDEDNQPFPQNPWDISEIDILSDVEPGGKILVKFQVKVPSSTGSYSLRFSMTENGKTIGTPSDLVKVSVQN